MAIALLNNGRKVWATVLFPSAIMHQKVILPMSVFLFLLPYLQDHGLLRSTNFATMTTWCNNFSFLQGLHAPWKSLKIAVGSGFWCLLYLSHILKCLKGANYAELVEELKLFEWSPWKMGNVSLKVLEKCLNFFVQKRVQNLFLITFMQIEFNQLSTLNGSKIFLLF